MSADPTPTLSARLAALERRVELLERGDAPTPDRRPAAASFRDRFWALEGLKGRLGGDDGAVLFTGLVPLPGGEWAEWQWTESSKALLAADWSDLAAALAALGHPVRLLLLRHVLSGVHSVADLADRDGLGTSGQLYHHLRQLVNTGWLRTTARGRYTVPADRIVPLLVALSAARRPEP
jgi:Helix-turn-helix domain